MTNVACAVINQAIEEGQASGRILTVHKKEGVAAYVRRKMYFPNYVPLVDPRRIWDEFEIQTRLCPHNTKTS